MIESKELIETYRDLAENISSEDYIKLGREFFKTKTRGLIFILILKNGGFTAYELIHDYGVCEATAYRNIKILLEENLIKVRGNELRYPKLPGPPTMVYNFNYENKEVKTR